MRIVPISSNAYKLTRFGLFNCYLLQEPDGLTLIDTGFPGAGAAIVQAAVSMDSAIRRIALTHAHGDHVGSVDEVMNSVPGIVLGASGRSVPLLRQPPEVTHPEGELGGKIKGSLPGIQSRLTQELRQGDIFGSLRVLETPGHIPGHLSFLDERDGTLFVGDALTCVGGLNIAGYSPWYFPMPNLFTWNKHLARESAKTLRQFNVQQFASGHGKVLTGGRSLLERSIAKASS